MEEETKCPVCLEVFPEDEPVAFALHVADCTASTTPLDAVAATELVSITARSCPMCHTVYGERMRPHEMEFHEIECARMNPKPSDSSGNGKDASGAAKTGKRSRESEDGLDTATANGALHRPVTLFPSFCALCSGGGRSLLQCAGTCARAFHSACVEQLHVSQSATAAHASASYTSSSSVRDKKSAQQAWTCGECTRGLHVCQSCGFMGQDARDLLKCSLDDCGFYFHPNCLPAAVRQHQSVLVCPRHACSQCHSVETDMRKCQSCTQCVTMKHRQCPAPPQDSSSTSTGDEHFFTCAKHTGTTVKASLAMKTRLAQGDLVLVLEYDNALLPENAKSAAPQAFNQWGVVLNAEDIDRSSQLLSVSLFSDGSVIAVGNRYVTFLASMNSFASPEVMLRTSIKWHALTEWNLRQLKPGNTDTPAAVALATCQAFRARTEALLLTLPQLQEEAARGVSFGQQHAATMRPFGSTDAPMYVFLDTRGGSRSSVNALAQLRIGERVENGSGGSETHDVDMADAQASTTRSSSTERSTGAVNGSAPSPSQPTDSNNAPVDGSPEVSALTASVVSQVVTKIVFDVVSQATKRLTNVAALVNRSCEIKVDQQPLLTSRSPLKPSFDQAKIDPWKLETSSHKAEKREEDDGPVPMELDDDLKKSSGTKRQLDISNSDDVSEEGEKTTELKRLKATAATFSGATAASSATVYMNSNSELNEVQKTALQSAFTVKGQAPQQRRPTRKQRRLASMPPGMLGELERQVTLFFEQQSEAQKRTTATYSTPSAYSVRPTMVIHRGGSRGRGLDAASHYLVTQEKRKLMCYLQGVASQACPHVIAAKCPFVTVDLMTLWDFASLERVVRTLVSNALPALQLTASPLCGKQQHVQLFACTDDGSYERIAAQPQQDWLCFCAGVRHLSAVVNP